MFVLSALVAAVPHALACAVPGPDGPPPPAWDLLVGTPVTPDGRAHVLTADDRSVCWWSVDDRGDAEVHRVWPLPGPHAVALAAGEDGSVLLVLRGTPGWGLLCVAPDGRERGLPVRAVGALVGFGVERGLARLEWRDGQGRRRFTGVDVATGAELPVSSETEAPHGAQSRR